jgi:hypothetical protein
MDKKIKVIKAHGYVDSVLYDGCSYIVIHCYRDGTLRVMVLGTTWHELYTAKYSSKSYAVKKAKGMILTFVHAYRGTI